MGYHPCSIGTHGEGTFKISVENKSSKDMVGVKVKTEDIKGLKIVKGKELEIGDVKVGEKKVLENEKIQFEVVEAIKDACKSVNRLPIITNHKQLRLGANIPY